MGPIEGLISGVSIAVIAIICLSFVGMTILSVVLIFVIRRFIMKKVGPDRAVLEQGTTAKAKILNVQQTGMMVNYSPQVILQLEVYPPDGEPYQATTKAVIPIVNIPQFQPGTEVSVKIHPTNPSIVELDYFGG